MRKRIFIIVAVILIFLLLAAYFIFQNGETDSCDFEKIDRSVFSNSKQLFKCYYVKPVVKSSIPGAPKINAFFTNDCNAFFESELYKAMEEDFKNSIDYLGEDALSRQPLCYYTENKVTFFSEQYISFCKTDVWLSSGSAQTMTKGVTFDCNTGERVSFTEFIPCGDKELKGKMRKDFEETFLKNENFMLYEEGIKLLSESTKTLFSFSSDGADIPFDKNFFYDGKNINITIEENLPSKNGLIYQVNTENLSKRRIYTYMQHYDKIEKYYWN